MKNGLKVDELEVGTMYECVISGDRMLVVDTKRHDGKEQDGVEPSGEKDEEGNDIMRPKMVPKMVDAKGGKSFYRDPNNKPQYLFSELHDGQMKAIV